MEDFYSKKGRSRALLMKENKWLFLDQEIFYGDKANISVFIIYNASSFMEEGPSMNNYFIGVYQKNSRLID